MVLSTKGKKETKNKQTELTGQVVKLKLAISKDKSSDSEGPANVRCGGSVQVCSVIDSLENPFWGFPDIAKKDVHPIVPSCVSQVAPVILYYHYSTFLKTRLYPEYHSITADCLAHLSFNKCWLNEWNCKAEGSKGCGSPNILPCIPCFSCDLTVYPQARPRASMDASPLCSQVSVLPQATPCRCTSCLASLPMIVNFKVLELLDRVNWYSSMACIDWVVSSTVCLTWEALYTRGRNKRVTR